MRIFKKIGFLFFLVLLLLLVGFEFFSHKLSFEQLSYIRTNYTTEEIVYFYETVFFSDDFYKIDKYKSKNGSSFFISNTKIKKWEKDLYVKPFGDFTNQNILSLKKAIDYLNSIELPIRLFYTEGESYNVRFFFGSKSFIRKETNYEFEDESDGFAKIYTNFSSTIDRAFIGIDNTLSPDYHRPDIILEELTQTLGILGDSYSHPNSLFYEGSRNRSPLNKLTYLDERILKLLYSENIKAGVSRKNFLKSFKDIIKISDGLIKEDFKNFEEFISLNQFSEETIRMFLNTAFSNGNQYVPEPHIQKWRNEINCRLENNISSKDSLAIVKLFEQLKIIPSFPKINLQTKNKNGNMMIGYCDGLMCDNHRWVSRDMLNYQLHTGRLLIPISLRNDKKIEAYFLKALMFLMGFSPSQTKNYNSELFNTGYGNPDQLFSPYDLELIKLFFDKSLKSGMTKKEIVKILQKYYSLDD